MAVKIKETQHKIYYVYIHRRATDDKIFYVGKGKENRYKKTTGRNNHWKNTANKYGWYSTIIQSEMSEDDALELEEFLIEVIGLDNLCNLNYFNGGKSGFKHTEEARIKMSLAKKGTVPWNKNKKCEYASVRMEGSKNPQYGKQKIHTKEVLQTLREKNGMLVCDLNTGIFYDSIIAMSIATNLDKRYKEFKSRLYKC